MSDKTDDINRRIIALIDGNKIAVKDPRVKQLAKTMFEWERDSYDLKAPYNKTYLIKLKEIFKDDKDLKE